MFSDFTRIGLLDSKLDMFKYVSSFAVVTNFHYLCYMEIEIGLTNGPIIGFALNYAEEEYPYDELVFYFLLAHITFKWNL